MANAGDESRRKLPRNFRAAVVMAIAIHLMFVTLTLNTKPRVQPIELQRMQDINILAMELDKQDIAEQEPDGAPESEKESQEEKQPEVSEEVVEKVELQSLSKLIRRPKPIPTPGSKNSLAENLRALEELNRASSSFQSNRLSASNAAAAYRGRGLAGKRDALKKFGGSKHTERAVLDGLRWLASVQDTDSANEGFRGRWDCDGFATAYLSKQKNESQRDYLDRLEAEGGGSHFFNLGLTGLCTLAFTGAGYTRDSGEFSRNLTLAFEYILSTQNADGGFMSPQRSSKGNMYDHAICLLALADYYALSKDAEFREPVKRGLKFMVNLQRLKGGWDYTVYPTPEHQQRSDLSITGFCLMAMMACKASGIEPPRSTMNEIKEFLDWSALPDGQAMYADVGSGARRKSKGMSAVNLFSRRLMGQPMTSEIQGSQKQVLLATLPNWSNANNHGDCLYQWYYTALALILEGGEDWEKFNIALKSSLLSSQVIEEGPRKGSWAPDTYYGERAGRVYSTAMAVLCLEVYYRYIPKYLLEENADLKGLWE